MESVGSIGVSIAKPLNWESIELRTSEHLPRLTKEERAQVHHLQFMWSHVPENFNPQDYPNLRSLGFDFYKLNPSGFNSTVDLRGLQQLEEVHLEHCGGFNSPVLVGNNPNLRKIYIWGCQSYNRPLDLIDLPALEEVVIAFDQPKRGQPFIPDLTINRDDIRPPQVFSEDESGALAEHYADAIGGAMNIRIRNCPNLNVLAYQGYIRDQDIVPDMQGGVDIIAWNRPPLSVKTNILLEGAANLATYSNRRDNHELIDAVRQKMEPTSRDDHGFLLTDRV